MADRSHDPIGRSRGNARCDTITMIILAGRHGYLVGSEELESAIVVAYRVAGFVNQSMMVTALCRLLDYAAWDTKFRQKAGGS